MTGRDHTCAPEVGLLFDRGMLPYESAAAAKRESPNDHMADLIKQRMGGQKYCRAS